MIVGRKVITLKEVTSTNDVAKQFAEEGEPEGLVITAGRQLKGRGRRGRGWNAEGGMGVILSAVVRPNWPESEAPWLGVLGGIAAAETVQELGIKGAAIKWPNDVTVDGRKIAGVLVEPRLSGGKIEFAVIGIGLNVLQKSSDWEPDLVARATSLAMHDVKASVEQVTQCLIERLDDCYDTALASGPEALMARWKSWSSSSELPVLD